MAASLFLEFLARNNALYRDGSKIISDGALVAITLIFEIMHRFLEKAEIIIIIFLKMGLTDG